MKTSFWRFSLWASCLVLSGDGLAQKPFMLYGPTSPGGDFISCGKYTGMSTDEKAQVGWWILGFVSGASRERALRNVSLAESDSAGVKAWTEKYCRDNPLDSIVKAAVATVDELQRRGLNP